MQWNKSKYKLSSSNLSTPKEIDNTIILKALFFHQNFTKIIFNLNKYIEIISLPFAVNALNSDLATIHNIEESGYK